MSKSNRSIFPSIGFHLKKRGGGEEKQKKLADNLLIMLIPTKNKIFNCLAAKPLESAKTIFLSV